MISTDSHTSEGVLVGRAIALSLETVVKVQYNVRRFFIM